MPSPEGKPLTCRVVSGPAWLGVGATSHVVPGTSPLPASSLGVQGMVLEAQDPAGSTIHPTTPPSMAPRSEP